MFVWRDLYRRETVEIDMVGDDGGIAFYLVSAIRRVRNLRIITYT
jgi:hypothetical protein